MLAGSSPPFLWRERAAVEVDVDYDVHYYIRLMFVGSAAALATIKHLCAQRGTADGLVVVMMFTIRWGLKPYMS